MPNWTKEQQLAIEDNGNSLIVSAAAGSGKTAVLVERIKRLVIEEKISLDNMLIVTFTNAAAAEMKDRLRDALSKAVKSCADDKQRKWLKTQLSVVGRADICTFDSFAIKLIKNYYHVIGVDPSLKICDDYKSRLIQKEAMDELFTKYYESKDSDFIYLLNHYTDAKTDTKAREMILSLVSFANILPDPNSFLENPFFSPERLMSIIADDADDLLETAEFMGLKLKALFECSEMPDLTRKLCENIAQIQSTRSLFANGYIQQGIEQAAALSFTVLKAKKEEKQQKEALDEEIKTYWNNGVLDIKKVLAANLKNITRELLSDELTLIKRPLSVLCRFAGEFMQITANKKLKAGLMDFNDSEHFAIEILKNEEVRKECRERYKAVFVDEYQDCNDLQECIINGVASENNVFCVGDVKQSIYKFRFAEPKLFINKYSSFKNGKKKTSKAIDLNSNFRSKKGVIEFVNKVFSELMTQKSSGIIYDEDAALKEGAAYGGPWVYEPELFIADSSESESADLQIDDLKSIELEALMAVNIIKEYHGKIFTDKSGTDRPLEYRDMAILFRSIQDRGEVFYNALTAAGIPVYIERTDGYFDTPEIQVFINLLRIIDNFSRDIPLISVLYFPVFGFTTQELAEIRVFANQLEKMSFSKAFKYYAESANGRLADKCSEFLKQIACWKVKKDAVPLKDFIWDLMYDSGIFLFASGLSGGEQRLSNLRLLVDKASDYERTNVGGLYGFLNYIDFISDKNTAVKSGQSGIVSSGENVVRIMTIHKSKGLEFPFVLLASCNYQNNQTDSNNKVVFHKNEGSSIYVSKPELPAHYVPKSFDIINLLKNKEDKAEEIRILYVAMTRARDFLVLSGTTRNSENLLKSREKYRMLGSRCGNYLEMSIPYFDKIKTFMRDDFDFSPFEKYSQDSEKLKNELRNGFEIDENKLTLSRAEIERRLGFDYAPIAGNMKKTKYSVSELASEQRNENGRLYNKGYDVPVFLSDKIKLSAADIGTAYHKVMEHIPFTSGGKSSAEISVFIEALKIKGILTDNEADKVSANRIAKFFESEIGQRICSADEIGKEVPFVIKHNVDGREVLVQGTIDCWFKKDGKLFLVDYKSNYVDMQKEDDEVKRLADTYAPQLALYKEALEKVGGIPVDSCYLYLFSANCCIKIDV